MGDWLRVKGKGGKHRDVPILKIVSDSIQKYLLLLPVEFVDEEFLFIGRRGGKLSPRIIQRLIQKFKLYVQKHHQNLELKLLQDDVKQI